MLWYNSLLPMAAFSARLGAAASIGSHWNSAIHPSCIASMSECLGEMGFPGFRFQTSILPLRFLNPWAICASKATLGGTCADGVGDSMMSEAGQMYQMQLDFGLVQDDKQCKDFKCEKRGFRDSDCVAYGCGACDRAGRCTSNF